MVNIKINIMRCTVSKISKYWLIDWLIDLHWVRALTVLMHLSLIDAPFVSHNLISVQHSPVPLPKFQMVPRLKILLVSGSKKGTQIYYPFLSKVPASESPPGSPMGPLWREMSISRAFLNISSRVSSQGALPRGPPHWASSKRKSSFSTKLATHLHISQDCDPQQ